MSDPLHRTQVLLRKDQHRALSDLARSRKTSLSKLLRDFVDEQLERQRRCAEARIERRLRALSEIESHGRSLRERRGGASLEVDPAALIRELREERDDELASRLDVRRD
jgi:hypothetical protein